MRPRAYRLENFCQQGPRIIVHPQGLPPSWKETNLTAEEEAMAMQHGVHGYAVHVDPKTFQKIEQFKIG